MDCNLPTSSVHGILQAKILEWVAMPSSRGLFPNPRIKPTSLMSPALAGGFFVTSTTWEALEKESNSTLSPMPLATGFPTLLAPPGSHTKRPCHLPAQSSRVQSCQRLERKSLNSAISPAPVAAASPAHMVRQGPHHSSSWDTPTPGSHWGRPKSSRAASGVNSCDNLHAMVGIKPQWWGF